MNNPTKIVVVASTLRACYNYTKFATRPEELEGLAGADIIVVDEKKIIPREVLDALDRCERINIVRYVK